MMVAKKKISYFDIWKIGGRRLSKQEEPARLLSFPVDPALLGAVRLGADGIAMSWSA